MNDLKMYACHFLAWPLTLLVKDRLPQCQDNVIEWDIGSQCWWPGLNCVDFMVFHQQFYNANSTPDLFTTIKEEYFVTFMRIANQYYKDTMSAHSHMFLGRKTPKPIAG